MSYENLFIGDFSDEQKNKICLKEPLESNSVRFEKDGFTIKLENGVELIHVANGIVIRVAQGKETPMKPVYTDETYDNYGETLYEYTCPLCETYIEVSGIMGYQPNYCDNCGQKLKWPEVTEWV